MSSLVYDLDGEKMNYEYRCRELYKENAEYSSCLVPPIDTKVTLTCDAPKKTGYVKEGYAFSPMFTLGYNAELKENEEVKTWLRLEKAN